MRWCRSRKTGKMELRPSSSLCPVVTRRVCVNGDADRSFRGPDANSTAFKALSDVDAVEMDWVSHG